MAQGFLFASFRGIVMNSRGFHFSDHEPEARLARLSPSQAEALEQALSRLAETTARKSKNLAEKLGLPTFLLPLAEFGLNSEAIIQLAEKVPEDYPFDHREIYFDFRLNRWIKHIEPPTVSEVLEEYLESSESPSQGIAYLEGQWKAFLSRHQKS